MKPQLNPPERVTLPATASGAAIAMLLCFGAVECERTAKLRPESITVGEGTFPVIVVELGKRPREGEIASRMKQNMEAEWGSRIKKSAKI